MMYRVQILCVVLVSSVHLFFGWEGTVPSTAQQEQYNKSWWFWRSSVRTCRGSLPEMTVSTNAAITKPGCVKLVQYLIKITMVYFCDFLFPFHTNLVGKCFFCACLVYKDWHNLPKNVVDHDVFFVILLLLWLFNLLCDAGEIFSRSQVSFPICLHPSFAKCKTRSKRWGGAFHKSCLNVKLFPTKWISINLIFPRMDKEGKTFTHQWRVNFRIYYS